MDLVLSGIKMGFRSAESWALGVLLSLSRGSLNMQHYWRHSLLACTIPSLLFFFFDSTVMMDWDDEGRMNYEIPRLHCGHWY